MAKKYESRISLDELVNQRMKQWELAARASDEDTDKEQAKKKAPRWGPVIAVSRSVGTNSTVVARLVGEKLGWKVFDREIVERIAAQAKIEELSVELMDERTRGLLDEVVRGLIFDRSMGQAQYFRHLMQTLMLVARDGRAVVVGRGGNFILKAPSTLSVRLTASVEHRVMIVAEREGLSHDEALEKVSDIDNERRRFIRNHFNRDINDPHLYDLVINVEKIPPSTAADLIVTAASKSILPASGVNV